MHFTADSLLKENLSADIKVYAKYTEIITVAAPTYSGGLKKALKYIIKQARQGVVNREYTKSKSIKAVDYVKTAYIRLARDMVSRGLLPDEDLIYFLSHEEVKRVIDG